MPVAPLEHRRDSRKDRERMKAGLRLGTAIGATGIMLAGAPLLAQTAPPETNTETPATDSIGPRELQNFNLQGTVTRPVEQQPSGPSAAPQSTARPRTAADAPSATEPRIAAPAPASQGQGLVQSAPAAQTVASTAPVRVPSPRPQPPLSSSVRVTLPPLDEATLAGGNAPSSAAEAGLADTAGSLAPRRGFPLLPWLLAAVVLGAVGAFFFLRNRSREAFANGPQIDAFVAPEPAARPRAASEPVSAPPAKVPPKPAGIVSTRLRPWLELNFDPIRCVVDEEKVTFEFELGLFNSGNGVAREVLLEATLFNAGPEQDREIAAFFESPVGKGQRIAAISPLQRISLRTEVSAPRNGLQLFEIAGRHVIVPLIGFNALYRWGISDGQTSQSFLLGRDTKGDKLAPFRMDLGPRIFRGLAARPLPQFVRN